MKFGTRALKKSEYAKELVNKETFTDVGSKDICLIQSEHFIGFKDMKNMEKITYLPKNYIIGVSEISERIARQADAYQFIYILITGEKFTHRVKYEVKGIKTEYRKALQEILPDSIITNTYAMDIWRDVYKEDIEAFFQKEKERVNLILDKVDFYKKLSRDGRFSQQLQKGDRVSIMDENTSYEGIIETVVSGSNKEGVMVTLESGKSGRVKKILSEIRKPIQYIDSESFDEDRIVYEKYLEEQKKYDFKEPGKDPKTGKISKFFIILFIIFFLYRILKVFIKF